jgi:hypothetical protein
MKFSTGTNIAIGAGAVLLAPVVLPKIASAARPALKALIKVGLIAYSQGKALTLGTAGVLQKVTVTPAKYVAKGSVALVEKTKKGSIALIEHSQLLAMEAKEKLTAFVAEAKEEIKDLAQEAKAEVAQNI